RDGEADRRETERLEADVVAAAPEPVGPPDLPHVQAEPEAPRQRIDEARQVARRRVVLPAKATLLRDQFRRRITPDALGDHPDMRRVAHPVRATAVADDVVVEI